MLYRCRKCEHEVAAGCLPTAGCGLYVFGLMGLVPVMLLGLVVFIRWLLPASPPPPDAPEPNFPWCPVIGVSLVVGPVVAFSGAWVLDLLFRTTEHFLMRWAKCPGCGSRKWSKGDIRGFGL